MTVPNPYNPWVSAPSLAQFSVPLRAGLQCLGEPWRRRTNGWNVAARCCCAQNHKAGQAGEVLTAADLKRTAELGRGVVAGTANSRLIGGKWKRLERPVEGDVSGGRDSVGGGGRRAWWCCVLSRALRCSLTLTPLNNSHAPCAGRVHRLLRQVSSCDTPAEPFARRRGGEDQQPTWHFDVHAGTEPTRPTTTDASTRPGRQSSRRTGWWRTARTPRSAPR